jgi:hypothetical protein
MDFKLLDTPIKAPTMKRNAYYEKLFWILCLVLNAFILSKGLSGPAVKPVMVSMPRAITHCKIDNYKADDKATESGMRIPDSTTDSMDLKLKFT